MTTVAIACQGGGSHTAFTGGALQCLLADRNHRIVALSGTSGGAVCAFLAWYGLGAAPSVGTVGDALDNALAESQIGLFKTELIRRRGPWKNVDDVELATLEWVDWHNNRRLHTACHDLTPVEYEQVFYGQHPTQQAVEVSTP